MGFYSDVYIKCKKEKIFKFKHFMEKYKEVYDIDLQKEEKFYADDEYLYLILYHWKFYTEYPAIEYIVDFVEHKDMECAIGMIAINEYNTTEEWGTPWEVDLSVSVNIEGM